MDDAPVHFSRRKPRRCPAFGEAQVVPIRYGFPTQESFSDETAGTVVLGGCVVTNHDPAWQCTACTTPIHRG